MEFMVQSSSLDLAGAAKIPPSKLEKPAAKLVGPLNDRPDALNNSANGLGDRISRWAVILPVISPSIHLPEEGCTRFSLLACQADPGSESCVVNLPKKNFVKRLAFDHDANVFYLAEQAASFHARKGIEGIDQNDLNLHKSENNGLNSPVNY